MKLEIIIPEDHKAEFITGILRMIPIPKDEETNVDLYTPEVWLQKWAKQRLIKLYKDGRKSKILREAENKIVYNITEG